MLKKILFSLITCIVFGFSACSRQISDSGSFINSSSVENSLSSENPEDLSNGSENSHTITVVRSNGQEEEFAYKEESFEETLTDILENCLTENTLQYEYSWDLKSLQNVLNGDRTLVELRSVCKYLIVFQNYDGSEWQKIYCEYGAVPVANGEPRRVNDDVYRYEFTGWSPNLAKVTGEATYVACYRQYFINETSPIPLQ